MEGLTTKLKVVAIVWVALSVIHCAKKGSSSSAPAACPANQISTAAGCLPQCGANMVWYNNQCVSPSVVTGAGAGAVPTSCGTGMLQSQYGCLLQCGPSSVWYQNQCVPASTGGAVGGMPGGGLPGGGTGYPPGGGGMDICSGRCGPGQVETYNGCLPQYTCGACYGFANGWCVIGVNAHAYYGF